jgi:MFS family permease
MTDGSNATPRSIFVTAVAWIFIGLAGFATLIAILQNIMIALVFPTEAIREAENAKDMPAFVRFLLSHPQIFFGSFLAVSAATLISAIGLLRRKNWARLLFIGIMALGILWNVGGMVMPYFVFSSMPPMPDHVPSDFRDGFDIFFKVMMVFTVLIGIAFACLFGWIIKRLMSHEIKREFVAL